MGIGRTNLHICEKDKLLTAYHEGGHALTSLLTDGATPLHKVTILPRGGALGFVFKFKFRIKNIFSKLDLNDSGKRYFKLHQKRNYSLN